MASNSVGFLLFGFLGAGCFCCFGRGGLVFFGGGLCVCEGCCFVLGFGWLFVCF